MYDPNFIVRADAPVQGKVGVISGGGSGHEPMHGGFVGYGMLDAACPGAVFTSPTPDQMLEATKAVNGGAGVLHIVKNYTGDIMNFEMAADLARSKGIEVEAVVIDDDVAVQDSLYTAGGAALAAPSWQKNCAELPLKKAAPPGCGRCLPQGQRYWAAAWAWRSPPAPSRTWASPPLTCRKTRWKSASASTANPDGHA
jgi:dihydroxyacetone kinase